VSYATIMVDDGSEQRVRIAAGLADKFAARLIGFSALELRPPVGAEASVIVQVIEEETEAAGKKLAERGSWFRKMAGLRGEKVEWRSALSYPADALAREALSADLVVVGRGGDPEDISSSLDVGGAILKSGRPARVVPQGIGSLRAKHVVIGWKDTREARRAVQDALPLLHEAARVTIVEICEAGSEEAAGNHIDDVERYLAHHRIKVGPKIVLREKGSPAAQLINVAQDAGADLLVIGAYGHSRLGEWFFGGVTRELIASSPICCLMSH
jgi:nucleotide-binding universal stress UspA family protein